MKLIKIFFATLILSSFVIAQTNWNFDKSHSKLGFSVSHMVITDVDGNFKEFDGTIITEGDNFENTKIELSANVASIDTDNEKRDNHLKSDDFFNAEKFPKLTFVGKSFTKVDDKNYKLLGDLTIRDKTKEVELDVEFNGMVNDSWGNTRAGFHLEGVINRFEFDLKWNNALETGGLIVGEEVTIIGKIELIKQK
jgi:polyisoprenoid-binding protein YceI